MPGERTALKHTFTFLTALLLAPVSAPAESLVLKTEEFRHYVEEFNQTDNELYKNCIPNAAAWDFLKGNIPLLDCPDEDIQKIYYFRWWTYRKHIRQTPKGFVVSEFLPKVSWAGEENTIICAAGHHIREGRWLADPKVLNDYIAFVFRTGFPPHNYSSWLADSVWQRYCVTGDPAEALRLLPALIAGYKGWESSKYHHETNGLYLQAAGADGMESSISGDGYRATINSYQFGDAIAIANIAELAGKPYVAKLYREKAAAIKELVQTKLWNADHQFFEVGLGPRGFGLFEWLINNDLALTKAAKASASAPGPVANLNHGIQPGDRRDWSVPHYDFDRHRGTEEWIQYDLATPTQVSSFSFSLMSWGGGDLDMPETFRVLYRRDGVWKEATDVKGGFSKPNLKDWDEITFAPVQADAVKLELSLCGADRSKIKLANVREQHGFTPWYFNLPDPLFAVAWKQAMDPKGFFAPWGLTTAEQRDPRCTFAGGGCAWNGPSWPFSTAVTLTGLANLLNGPAQDAIGLKDYFQLLQIYAKAQRLTLHDGRVVPWIDENQNPITGDWIVRTGLIKSKKYSPDDKQPVERGKDYNHSTFCDLVINGLIGLRPRTGDTVEVNPLVPDGTWDHFSLDQIHYHGHWLTIVYDKAGKRYGKGRGLRVFADGKEIAASEQLQRVTGHLPTRAAASK